MNANFARNIFSYKVLYDHYQGHAWANKFKGGLKKRRFGEPLNILNSLYDRCNLPQNIFV